MCKQTCKECPLLSGKKSTECDKVGIVIVNTLPVNKKIKNSTRITT